MVAAVSSLRPALDCFKVKEVLLLKSQIITLTLVCSSSAASKGKGIIDLAGKGGVGHVLITSFASMRINHDHINRYSWHYVILDEGHMVW